MADGVGEGWCGWKVVRVQGVAGGRWSGWRVVWVVDVVGGGGADEVTVKVK